MCTAQTVDVCKCRSVRTQSSELKTAKTNNVSYSPAGAIYLDGKSPMQVDGNTSFFYNHAEGDGGEQLPKWVLLQSSTTESNISSVTSRGAFE